MAQAWKVCMGASSSRVRISPLPQKYMPKRKVTSSNKINDLYKLYFEYVLHESKAVWDTGQLFLVANTFLAAILGSNIPNNQIGFDINRKITFWFLSIIGLLISIFWLVSFERIKKHYHFRMNQAKKLEDGFEIFSGKAERLAHGGVEKINDEKYDFKLFGLINISSFISLRIIIFSFFFFYVYLVIHFFPWKINLYTKHKTYNLKIRIINNVLNYKD